MWDAWIGMVKMHWQALHLLFCKVWFCLVLVNQDFHYISEFGHIGDYLKAG